MQAALQVIGDDEPDGDVALLTVRLGNALLFTGELERGGELIERALDMGEALGLPEILVFGWSGKGIWMSRGRRHEAELLVQGAADLALEHGLLDRASVSFGNLSDQSFQADAYPAALAHLERVREIAQQAGDRPNEWFSSSERTYPLYMLGRWDEALEAFAELPEEQLSIGFTLLSPITSIVEIHIHRGELERARQIMALYEPMNRSIDVQDRAGYLSGAAALAFAEGRHAEAIEHGLEGFEAGNLIGPNAQAVKQATLWTAEAASVLGREETLTTMLEFVEQLPPGRKSPLMLGHMHRLRGRSAADVEAASAEYAQAERLFEETGIVFWLAVTRLEHAEALVRGGGDPARARALLDAARETFVRLNARPWAERADAVGVGVAEGVGGE
jgi:tetratricopeptide (TPR) repeat protein